MEKRVWNKKAELDFVSGMKDSGTLVNSGCSRNWDGNDKIQCEALDDVITEKVTLIKIDIEGSEM